MSIESAINLGQILYYNRLWLAPCAAAQQLLYNIRETTRKIKRGYYEVEFELITENPKEYKDYQLTDKFLEITERNIRNQPEVYLWSHKRFKHRDKVPASTS